MGLTRLDLLHARAKVWKRVLDATYRVPLPWMLDALHAMRRIVPRRVTDWAEPAIEHLGLEGAAARDFSQRVWWASQASKAVRARLEQRPADVMTELGGDAAAIHAAHARGRGLLVLGAHQGPMWVAATWLRDHYPDTLFLIATRWASHGRARVMGIGKGDAREGPLVEAVRELRRGGIVYIAPDAAIGKLAYQVPVRGHLLPMAAGAPTLARLAQVPAIPLVAAWQDDALALLCGPTIEPPANGPAASAHAAEQAWLAAYLATIDGWQSALGPENIRYGASLVLALGLRGRPI